MKTYLSWDSYVEENEKTADVPEDSPFECPKLNRGDIISLEIGKPRGQHLLTPVKVSMALIDIGWVISKDAKDTVIQDAEQYLFIEPFVADPVKAKAVIGQTKRRRRLR
jgi:hypothetical protein